MAILDLKMAIEFSENIFILSAAINWTSNLGFIQFKIFFFTFMSLLYQKGLKMVIFGIEMVIFGQKMVILDFKMAKKLSENILSEWQQWIILANLFSSILIRLLLPSCLSNIKKAILMFLSYQTMSTSEEIISSKTIHG